MRQGISLIIVDNEDNVEVLLQRLNVVDAVPLSTLYDNVDKVEDLVFYHVMKTSQEEAERFAYCYNLRRALLWVDGHVHAHGGDLNWVKASLFRIEPARPIPVPEVQVAVDKALPAGFSTLPSFQAPEERDDPYADLGYRR